LDSVNLSRLLAQLTDAFASAEENEGEVRLNVTGKNGKIVREEKRFFDIYADRSRETSGTARKSACRVERHCLQTSVCGTVS
jgi:hypothetical protein